MPYEIWGYNEPMSLLSVTGGGAIVLIVSAALKWFGVEVADGQIDTAVKAIIDLAGIFMLVYGQLRRKDLVAGIVRRDRLN